MALLELAVAVWLVGRAISLALAGLAVLAILICIGLAIAGAERRP